MSSYIPPHMRNKRQQWKPTAEDESKKYAKTEQNFPSLSARAQTSARGAPSGNKYAQLAQQWAVDDEVSRQMEAYKKDKEERERRERESMFVFRQRQREGSRFDNYEEEYDEDVSAPSYRDPALDDEGWTTIDRKSRKEKRELTVEEMDRLQAEQDRKEDDFELNGHLFESNRHDHDRV